MFSFYSQLSTEVYDLDKPIGHSFGDVEYYNERLKDCKGRILEPAAGTGRILIPLLEDGFEVDGMDYSPEMLQICRNHCEKRGLEPKLYEADMSALALPEKYEAVILPTGSFLLLTDRKKSMEALDCFYNHLEDGGRLIIDLFIPTEFEMGKVGTRSWKNQDGDLITLESKLVDVNFINQTTIYHHKYEKWHNNKLIETELEEFPLRWYGAEEFKLVLEKVGFKDITVSADYEYGKEPTKDSEIITFEAKK
ncbi:class I SAM-dependent methyltransferase [Bacillus shivajii]|uniref:class I SAM-dependent methyltransferase n=1 Tax=Bacillus shivajii TaxID=1983719 RepID=UPI001CFA695A|nr:class I SAM-dependent methyltransferase [Bacillus shivajii]UCZ53450.1 class I SAM-dependent methyltransferase [Bacillus shivajii]